MPEITEVFPKSVMFDDGILDIMDATIVTLVTRHKQYYIYEKIKFFTMDMTAEVSVEITLHNPHNKNDCVIREGEAKYQEAEEGCEILITFKDNGEIWKFTTY